ncbi:RidA family protein [Leisingera sp. ANG-Vp]|uniref:RidA family protein n=1 Tax=Leisingera sp. ANG-Vp TaxID=1577896 RepID=UPI0009E651DA|nr:RidA family protein [Leisingera sp. ANG-Vp]
MRIEERLERLGLVLPPSPVPAAHYRPWVRNGDIVFLAGQTPKVGTELKYRGQVGTELDLNAARAAAELCALRLLSALQEATGDLNEVAHIPKLTVFVNAVPGFASHPKVADGASDLISAVLGEVGHHARSAVGVSSLPGNAAVEVEMIACCP